MIYVKKKSWIKKIKNVFLKINDIPCVNIFPFFKKTLGIIFALFICLYACYLFILPKFLNEENFEPLLNKYLSKNTKLILDIDNLVIKPNYKFDINLKADKFKLKYSKNSDFIVLDNLNIDVNIFSFLFGYIDLSKIKADKTAVFVNFTEGKKYSCFEYFNPKILEFNSKKTKFQLRNFNFYTDKFIFNLYDDNVKKNFVVNANNLKFSSIPTIDFKNRNYEISAKGYINAPTHRILDFNLKLNFKTKINAISKFNEILLKMRFNPLVYADEYKFYSRANVDLKILPQEKKININGVVELSDYSFKVGDVRLPKNNVLINFKQDKIYANCDFNLIKNQFIKVKAKANSSKNKFIELNLISNDINLREFKEILNVFCKIFNSKINADDITLSGFASADLYLKSDFKTINSDGKFEIKNASLAHKKSGLNLKNINSKINLQNNKIDIIDASANFGESKFHMIGSIDDKTNLNLKINSDVINITSIINLLKTLPFVSSYIPTLNDYIFKSGFAKISAEIKGNFKNPLISTNSRLENVRIYIKSLKSEIFSKEIIVFALPNDFSNKTISIKALNSNVQFSNNIAYIKDIKLKANENNILIEKTDVCLDKITAQIEGIIKNYNQKNINAVIKLKANLPSNNKFIVIKTLSKTPAKLDLELNILKDRIVFNNSSVFADNKKIVSITGNINNYSSNDLILNNIKLNFDTKTSLYLPLYSLGFDVLGDIILNGKINSLKIDGNLNLYNVASREFNLYISDILLNIKNSSVYINIVHGKIFGFDFDLIAQTKLLKDKILVDFAQFSSTYINLDTLNKYLKNDGGLNIEILDFKGNILTLEMMNMLLNSVYIEGSYKDNILTAKNFKADIYNGKITGEFIYNIKTNKTNAEMLLKEINVRLLTNGVKEIKDLSIAASGKLSALIKASFSCVDLNSILKTLDGYIKFNIDNGELAQFAKLERFLQAGNILSQSILKLTLNSTLSAITNQNTGDFKTIEGTLKIKNSNADVQYIKTQGTNMSLYMTGDFNLITQNCNMNIFGKIPYSMVSVLGPIGKFSTEQIVDKMSDDAKNIIKSITVSPFEKMLSEEIPEEYISKIPSLAYTSDVPTREFKVRVIGNPKNVSSVKFFKWQKKQL